MNALRLTAFLVVVAFSACSVVESPSRDTFELLILHNNDMHARFEQTSQLSGTCTTADREAGKCYGGFPRVAYVVKQARKAAALGEGPPILYLNAGDTYTGTAWFTIYKWKIAAEFLNALQPDAVSLVNDDLQAYSGQTDFIDNIESPILATNVIIKGSRNIHKSIILDVNGKNVGLVGYFTPGSNILDNPGDIEYIDEIIALKEEIEKLKALNVNIIIALGHANHEKDLEIAREVDGLDVVIGGYKNTFFWNGNNIDPNLPKISRPQIISQISGRTVPVIQSYAYDKYLGNITLRFDEHDEIVNFVDSPILLDVSSPQDVNSINIINKFSAELSRTSSEVIGSTAVVLDGKTCGAFECNLGNLITDAIVYYNALHFDGVWTNAPIAILHSGAISDSIAPENRPATITNLDLLSVLPLESSLRIVNMSGSVLNEVLEYSVFNYSITHPIGRFLHYSGIRVVYDMANDPGSRLVSAVARANGFVPEFYAINENSIYNVLMPAALADGEFGFPMLSDLPSEEVAYDEITSLTEYIRQRSPVYPEVADRITITGLDDFNDPGSANAISSAITIVLLCLIPLLI